MSRASSGNVLRVVRALAQANAMSMVIVTHEISFAADIADRVIMFDAGKIVEQGPPAEVLKNPENPRTRQFLRAVLERWGRLQKRNPASSPRPGPSGFTSPRC